MKNMKKALLLTLCAVMLLSLCACGKSNQEYYRTDNGYTPEPIYKESSASYAAAGTGNGLAMMAVDYAAEEAYDYEASYTSAPKEAPVSGGEGTESDSTEEDLNPEKIIYSSDVTLETTDFDSTTASVNALIDSCGGWLESSSVSGANYNTIARGSKTNRSANYTIRVPNAQFDSLMNGLNTLGNVPYSHVYTENVTAQYYDTQARLTTYQAQEKRLLELLDDAVTVSDVIEVENELTEVRYRIESMQTSLRNWDRRVSWSTIYLAVNEVSEYTPEKKISYGKRLSNALRYGLEDLGDTFVDFVEILPVLIFLVILLILVILIVKKAVRRLPKLSEKLREKRKAKKAAKAEEQK